MPEGGASPPWHHQDTPSTAAARPLRGGEQSKPTATTREPRPAIAPVRLGAEAAEAGGWRRASPPLG